MKKTSTFFRYVLFGLTSVVTLSCMNDHFVQDPPFITGLNAPMGFAKESNGRLWVTEAGTGSNDAKLTLISTDGEKKTVLSGLVSVTANGTVEGIGRPYIDGDSLYFTHGTEGMLYKLKKAVSAVTFGELPLTLSAFDSREIGKFARKLPSTLDSNTNVIDMIKSTDGHLLLLDAGANAIIKRDKTTGELSSFAEFGRITTPPFPRDAVPTAIVWDGTKYLVSALTGYPFVEGSSQVYSVSADGKTISVYKSGFTSLIHLELDKNNKPVVLQFATFVQPPPPPTPGFQSGTGKINAENGTHLLGNLDKPVDLIRYGANDYYLLSNGDGTIKKISF